MVELRRKVPLGSVFTLTPLKASSYILKGSMVFSDPVLAVIEDEKVRGL